MEWRYIVRSKELRRRRIEMGVTTERVAEVLNVPEYRIVSYENGGGLLNLYRTS